MFSKEAVSSAVGSIGISGS